MNEQPWTPGTTHVRFLSDRGTEFHADIDNTLLATLRAGYPMKGWPYPWREVQ